MRILFICKDINLSQPMGILSLSAVLRAQGHHTGYSPYQKSV
jgi:predicted transcriptional regulator